MRFQKEFLQQFETEIRAGRGQHVFKQLTKINSMSVPREDRLQFANICRRVGHFSLGLKILGPVVYPERGAALEQATARELAEYAVLLVRSGIHGEARSLLAKVDVSQAPEALLFRAFTHFEHWEFRPAVPLLERYVETHVTAYQQLVGRVNLAYAYVGSGRTEDALKTLDLNIRQCNEGGYGVLKVNCYELLTRLHAQNGDHDLALKTLEEARRNSGPGNGNEQKLITKWSAILESMRTGDLAPLLKYRETLTRFQSEYKREVDRFSLRIQFDQERFNHLIFGTSSLAYREIVCAELGRTPSLQEYILGSEDGPILDLSTGKIDDQEGLSAGLKCHALIEVLSRDFYKGLPLGELFVELYPGEKFDIFSSPNRVRQILHRTREMLREHSIPINVNFENGLYYIETTAPLSFAVPLTRRRVDGYNLYLEQLREHYEPQQVFQVKEAREKLNIPRTTFFRFTTWAVNSGALEKLGDYNTSKYKLVA